MLLDIEIEPQVTVVWPDEATKALWEPRLQAISRAHHRAEIEMVARGHRRATTVNLKPQSFEHDLEWFAGLGLVFLPIKRTKQYSGFAHKHVYTTGEDPDSMVYGCVAQSLEDAKAFKEASLGCINHGDIGELLGYPKCCRDFFERVWVRERWIDTIYHQAANTPGHEYAEDDSGRRIVKVSGHPFCQQALRYLGVRITSHLPCSFTCEKTVRWGQTWFDVLAEVDPDAAGWAMEVLSMPTTWDALKGIVVCDTPIFRGVANSVPCYPAHVVHYRPV